MQEMQQRQTQKVVIIDEYRENRTVDKDKLEEKITGLRNARQALLLLGKFKVKGLKVTEETTLSELQGVYDRSDGGIIWSIVNTLEADNFDETIMLHELPERIAERIRQYQKILENRQKKVVK
jgi:hypothetical protein